MVEDNPFMQVPSTVLVRLMLVINASFRSWCCATCAVGEFQAKVSDVLAETVKKTALKITRVVSVGWSNGQ